MKKKIVFSLLCLLVSPLFAPKMQTRQGADSKQNRPYRRFKQQKRICEECGSVKFFNADSKFVCSLCKAKKRRRASRLVN